MTDSMDLVVKLGPDSGTPYFPLGEVVSLMRREIKADPETDYTELGVRSFHKGTFHRRTVQGSEFTWQDLYEVRQDDLIFSNIMAWEGAVALAKPEDDGCIGNHRMLTCACDTTRVNPAFLAYYFSTPEGMSRLVAASTGTAARNRTLTAKSLAKIEVPAPAIEKQAAIVRHLRAIEARTQQLNEHLAAIEADANSLLRTFVFGCTERRPLADLVRQKNLDVTVNPSQTYQFAGVYSFGRGVFKSACKSGSDFAYPRLSTVSKGDFIYPKLMAWEGALGVVPEECDGMVVSPEFPVFEVNQDLVILEILDIYFKTPAIWQELAEVSGGTNMRRRRLQPSAFLAHRIPVPSRKTQETIRSLHQKLMEVRARNTQISAANDALIPATLERIFLR
jgi:type I restriction enzyme, S subunit